MGCIPSNNLSNNDYQYNTPNSILRKKNLRGRSFSINNSIILKGNEFKCENYIINEKFNKIDNCNVCEWFEKFTKDIDIKLPKYIMFNNKNNCIFLTFLKKIKIILDKTVLESNDEIKFSYFENIKYFIDFKTNLINNYLRFNFSIENNNIINNPIIKKYLKYININIYKNDIQPFIVYKKMRVKYDFYYIPLSNYNIVKTRIDIIKTIQILELLGCKTLNIHYKDITEQNKKFVNNLNTEFVNIDNGVATKKYNENENSRSNSYEFIDKLFLDEEDLLTFINLNSHIFMDNSDYLSDIELRFLIRSRINSYLKEYSRSFFLKKLNSIEINIQACVKNLYSNIGLNFKYNTSKYSESSFIINCVFFSLNDINDISSLPLDSIGFYTIKKKLFEDKHDNIINLLNKQPDVNNIVIINLNLNKYFAKIIEIMDDNMYKINILDINYETTISRENITNLELNNNDNNKNEKFIKEITKFLERLLNIKYKKYIVNRQISERQYNFEETYLSLHQKIYYI